MQIELYKLQKSIKRNTVDKKSVILNQFIEDNSLYSIQLNGEFRDAVDVSNPTIVIDISSTSNIGVFPSTSSDEQRIADFRNNPFEFNYIYIGLVKRYYFIKKIILLRNNILSIDLHVDVLSSFVNFIYNQNAFISRNEKIYNNLLPDERRIVTNETEVIYHSLTDTLQNDEYVKFNVDFNDYPALNPPNNIVAMVNNIFITNGWIKGGNEHIEPPIGTDLPSIYRDTFFTPITCNYLINKDYYSDLLTFIRNNTNYESFLIQAFAFPFDFKNIKPFSTNWDNPAYQQQLVIADQYVESPLAILLHVTSRMTSTYMLNTSFILNNNITDFNDLEPYSKYELYIPYYGYYELNYNSLKGHELYLYYIVSFQDGSATVILYDNTEDMIITSLKCQLGIELPKSTSNITEVRNRHDANNTSLVLGVIASILSVVGGITTGGATAPLAIAGGALAGAKSIGSYVTSEKSNLLQNGNINFNGSTSPLFAPQTAFIRQTKRKIQYLLNPDFLSENGGVLNELWNIRTFVQDENGKGYTEIADIPNINYEVWDGDDNTPTDTEIDEIISLLKSGVIFN